MGAGEVVPEVLREYGDATRALLFEYLPRREPRRYLYDLVSDYPRRGGRGFRPSLCVAMARLHGGTVEGALHAAASIEMMHNAMLIHDDIEDESEVRRGRPTLHAAHGVPLALNAGDLLTLLSLRPLLDSRRRLGPWMSTRLIEETERMATESAEGQALEIGWRVDNVTDLREADYLTMVLKKTCWLTTIHPARVGALIGSRGRADLEPFVRFGFFLGAAFQIQDDLLNLEGDPEDYGKELGGDLLEGKRTLMLIRLFESATAAERARLREVYALPRSERTPAVAREVRAMMDRYGAVAYARELAHGLAGAAQHECAQIVRGMPDTRDRSFIEALPAWVIQRA